MQSLALYKMSYIKLLGNLDTTIYACLGANRLNKNGTGRFVLNGEDFPNYSNVGGNSRRSIRLRFPSKGKDFSN